jgi:hypothetical protein
MIILNPCDHVFVILGMTSVIERRTVAQVMY